jgi:general secretion pathway protein L
MKTWLYLTAEGLAAPSLDWPSCVWSSTGQRQIMPLNQAAPELKGQAVDLLLPMELCSWVRSEPGPPGVDLPHKPSPSPLKSSWVNPWKNCT